MAYGENIKIGYKLRKSGVVHILQHHIRHHRRVIESEMCLLFLLLFFFWRSRRCPSLNCPGNLQKRLIRKIEKQSFTSWQLSVSVSYHSVKFTFTLTWLNSCLSSQAAGGRSFTRPHSFELVQDFSIRKAYGIMLTCSGFCNLLTFMSGHPRQKLSPKFDSKSIHSLRGVLWSTNYMQMLNTGSTWKINGVFMSNYSHIFVKI